jgi:transcriptional regulator with XRE-family HTH domain
MLAGETKQDQGTPIRIEYDRLAEPVAGALGIMREDHLARRIKYEMDQRGWSQEKLAAAMADAGHPVHQSAISKIINPARDGKRRTISVDEALGFAKVFGVPLESLLVPLGAVQSKEARQIMERIKVLRGASEALADESRQLWTRLLALVDQMERAGVAEGITNTLWEFLYESVGRANVVLLRKKAQLAGRNWAQFVDENLGLLEALRRFIGEVTKDDPDLDWCRQFVDDDAGRIGESFQGLDSRILAVWERLQQGERITRNDVTAIAEWVRQQIDALQRTTNMVVTDSLSNDVFPVVNMGDHEAEAAE